MENISDLEQLLQKQSQVIDEAKEIRNEQSDTNKSTRLKSEKGASMLDFIKMIDKMVTSLMDDLKVKFIPEEGKVVYLSTDQKLDNPMITYKLISRKSKKESKPRLRETVLENFDNNSSRTGEIYGQKFQCHLQFNVYASVYEVAEQVMDRFEDMMITYAGYFKQNGVGEIFFDEQLTDESFEAIRQTLSIRNFRYYVEIEKVRVIMNENIKEINTYSDI
jgi:hypothetical protein